MTKFTKGQENVKNHDYSHAEGTEQIEEGLKKQ